MFDLGPKFNNWNKKDSKHNRSVERLRTMWIKQRSDWVSKMTDNIMTSTELQQLYLSGGSNGK
jgi:hypothetical protein